jgi:hypothetical protein
MWKRKELLHIDLPLSFSNVLFCTRGISIYGSEAFLESKFLSRQILICGSPGSHGVEYEGNCVPVCCTVWSGRRLSTCQRFLLPPYQGHAIAMLMKSVSTCETSVNLYQATRCDIPQDSHLNLCLHVTVVT